MKDKFKKRMSYFQSFHIENIIIVKHFQIYCFKEDTF